MAQNFGFILSTQDIHPCAIVTTGRVRDEFLERL
jgi:hypothetical protein